MAVDKTKNAQILLTLPKELLEDVEIYWHIKHLKNRNKAILDAIQAGIAQHKDEIELHKKKIHN